MNNILLISSNKKEEEVLKLLLEQSSFKVISSIPDYANYLKILQFKPRLILIEMPSNYVNQISYMKMVRRNKNTRKTPIISFGSHSDKFITNSFVASGSNEYISRPLKAKDLLEKFQRLLRLKSLPSEKNKNEEEQELSEIMLDENKAGSEKINAVVSHVDKVLAFPFTVAKLLKISSSEESGASDLAKVIKSDPVITAKILKVCNSVLFATRNNKTISDVKKAIVRIGFNETKHIAMSMSVINLFSKDEKSTGFDRIDFWYHSLATAVISEKLASTSGVANPEDAFVAGLLHDFGIMIMDEFMGNVFFKVIEKTLNTPIKFIDAEKETTGVDHTDFSAELFEKWKLPSAIINSMKNNHRYLEIAEDSEDSGITQCVGLANIIARSLSIGKDVDYFIHYPTDEIFKKLKLPHGLQSKFFDDIFEQMNMFNKFLNIDKRSFPDPDMSIPGKDEETRIVYIKNKKEKFNPVFAFTKNLTENILETSFEKPETDFEPGVKNVFIYDFSKEVFDLSKIKSPEASPKIIIGQKEKNDERTRYYADEINLRFLENDITFFTTGKETIKREFVGKEDENSIHISIRDLQDGIKCVDIKGRMIVANMLKIQKKMINILKENPKYLSLDLSKISFIDSNGIMLIINLNKRISKNGGKFCLLSPSENVTDLLKINNISDLVTIAHSEKELEKVFDIELPPMEEIDPEVYDVGGDEIV